MMGRNVLNIKSPWIHIDWSVINKSRIRPRRMRMYHSNEKDIANNILCVFVLQARLGLGPGWIFAALWNAANVWTFAIHGRRV